MVDTSQLIKSGDQHTKGKSIGTVIIVIELILEQNEEIVIVPDPMVLSKSMAGHQKTCYPAESGNAVVENRSKAVL